MKTKTLRGICKRCCPDGGAVFTRTYDDNMKPVKKCNCCFAETPIRQIKKPTGPNASQTEILDILKENGWVVTVEMIGRKVFVNATNAGRNMWSGDSLFGTIGPCGKLKLKLQRIGKDYEVTDYWGLRELRRA